MKGITRTLIFLLVVLTLVTCNTPKKKIRILSAGIAHESNSFNTSLTTDKDFVIRRDSDCLRNQEWANYLKSEGVEIIPTLHVDASPSGTVSRKTYETFRDEILERVTNAGDIDGIYLEMHGALNAEGYDDAQLDLIRSIRKIKGDILMAGSFDLHGNMSKEFVTELNILSGYRTAPHVDMAETRLRAVTLLLKAIREDLHPVIAHINIPIVIPGEKGVTAAEPLRSVYTQLPAIGSTEGFLDASIFVGMPWTDVNRAGMSVQVVAKDKSFLDKATVEARRLANEIWSHRGELKFDVPVSELDDAIETAKAAEEKTVFITDSGDNTTAGAAGDNPLVLSRLLAHHVKDAVVAGIVDENAVNVCEKAGIGGEVSMNIGGKADTVFGKPFKITGKVHSIVASGGSITPFGKQAVVDLPGIQLVLISKIGSFTSPQDFANVSIDPLAHKIVVVKLGYLFQGLRDIAPRTIMALTPGFAYQVVEKLPYQHIRRPIYPLDPDMNWSAE